MGLRISDHMQYRKNQEGGLVNGFCADSGVMREIRCLHADQYRTRTGMREDIIRLAWLIVLMRTREGSQVSYEWNYRQPSSSDFPEHEVDGAQLIKGLDESVETVSKRIWQTSAPTMSSDLDVLTEPDSMILSTSVLFKQADEPEGVLQVEVSYNQDSPERGRIMVKPVLRSRDMLDNEVSRYIRSLVDTVEICLTNDQATIQECLALTPSDFEEIWGYNHVLPPTYDFCMQDMVSERAQQFPDKVAVDSWDGTLTFGEIEQHSTSMAQTLVLEGVRPYDIVPLCFEKSRWAIVAVLATMKAGATFAMMDPSLPLARLQNMAVQIGAKVIVSSRIQHDFAKTILPEGKHFVVEDVAFKNTTSGKSVKLPSVDPDTLMYIIFTSGSTGTPKGVTISHKTYTSSAIPRAKAVGYTEKSRVLDFASYAFDVSIDSMFLTVGNGGCLCIPSDEDRLNDINGVIRDMKINYAGITPSMARILDSDVIKSLDVLGLGGEAASARDVNFWGQDTRIVIGYGPCECTIGCTINSDTATGRDYISIGTGNGACMWIVNPDDHEQLMPAGAVGELLVEGPIVGQGYLNDPEKTASVFINDPGWLVKGHKSYAGRGGRLYKTGDLGKYDPDGSGGIIFAGRKDTQVKLRGQRVELGEIESQLGARLPSGTTVIAEVVVPQGSGGQATLVAFVAPVASKGHGQTDISSIQLPDEFRDALSKADAEVKKVLPRYMVPTSYIPVNHIPVLISGKTDRKQLKAFGATVDLRDLDQGSADAGRELSDLERRLQQAWGQVLNLDASGIRLEDNFFALGGDSLAAMRLVSSCRAQGLILSVIDTFGNPNLSAMASVVRTGDAEVKKEILPFSTITRSVEEARLEASQVCRTGVKSVEDIYPCTPTQESLFTFSLKSVELYLAQRVAVIPQGMDVNALKQAWEKVVTANPILRTRAAQLQEPGLQQVVLKEGISWRHATNLTQYLESDKNERMDLGENLARYAIIESAGDDKRYMVWSVHHLLYDGWSEPLILKQVSDALQDQATEIPARMRDFVEYVRETDGIAMEDFWRQELKGAFGPQFPRMPSRDFVPTPDAMVERIIPLETGAGSPFTLATLIRGAWALVASQYSGSDDVLFGETLTGRDIALAGVESIVGPLIATVPIRVRVNRASTLESFLQSVQQSILARTPYQHMGWQNIRKVSQDAQHASEAPTGLVIQPEPEYVGNDLGFQLGDVVREALHFNPYPLMVGCGIRKDGFRVCANFDSSLIEVPQMERILAQLEVACSQLTKDLTRLVGDVSCLPKTELDQIWQWNRTPPLAYDESSGRFGTDAGAKQGSIYPLAMVAWVCDSRNPAFLTPVGSVGELWLEGNCLLGDVIESPAWLLAGSSSYPGRTGKVQATGDLVELRADGRLMFVARKDNFLPIQGHAVDFADLEAHVARYLPPATRGATAVRESSTDDNQEIVVFIDQRPSLEDSVNVLSGDHQVEGMQTVIRASIPVELAFALKKLDKYIHDSLPSYVAPSAYIVVDNLPTNKAGQIDHDALNRLASNTSSDILAQLREGLEMAWSASTAHTKLTVPETILRTAWAKILRIDAEKIDVDDNFFRLGGDSVLAMKLVSSLRSRGHALSVADIFRHMRLSDAAKVMKLDAVEKAKKQTQLYKPFSTLGMSDVEKFLSDAVKPKLANSSWIVRDVLPVTDTQALDIKQTISPPRTSLQYSTMIFDQGMNSEKLFDACKQLVQTQEILRTVFIEHDSIFYQVVLEELDEIVVCEQVEGDVKQQIEALCTADIEQDFPLGSSFAKITHVRANDGKEALVFRLSHAQYDGVSLPTLLTDLETLYKGGKIVSEPFANYISATLEPSAQSKSLDYWKNLLSGSSLSSYGTSTRENEKGIFKSTAVDIADKPSDVTTASILTAAWGVVLSRRIQTNDIVFGAVTSGRNIAVPNIEAVMGPCYQFAPVRINLTTCQDTSTLLRNIATQLAESSSHDYIGFSKIAAAVGWEEATGFGSLVHHQDDEDDVDTMPFADGVCNVDLLKPHGDSCVPFKVVSFVKGGETHVGVVGSESEVALVDDVLGELVGAVGEVLGGGKLSV
ncbi:nonribosomal peptide synthase SidD [Aureobasidium subglaciale]|nr:nonribosomal peptide synthase SidD [Aureobasidium subglaciale]KAI5218782.1 nonribosomal peptide synthase SidD [Aureobasidium subglaciale]KAI5222399.1 nonribosomal peptide synthase SidD [Aureobasidium subglaciale]KAI5259842.1 nonribosomal peptide synthase SidD [Aureobasidium subglaciale]